MYVKTSFRPVLGREKVASLIPVLQTSANCTQTHEDKMRGTDYRRFVSFHQYWIWMVISKTSQLSQVNFICVNFIFCRKIADISPTIANISENSTLRMWLCNFKCVGVATIVTRIKVKLQETTFSKAEKRDPLMEKPATL